MQATGWIGVLVGMAVIAAAKLETPPVILELGPVLPTPAPSPKPAERKRLISVITVQNAADGESVVSFEASDVADEGDGKFRPLASKTYSLAEEDPKGRQLRAKILAQVRALERDMLEYAQIAGPPKERAPLGPSQQRPASGPYR
jgi:hypothetical protein